MFVRIYFHSNFFSLEFDQRLNNRHAHCTTMTFTQTTVATYNWENIYLTCKISLCFSSLPRVMCLFNIRSQHRYNWHCTSVTPEYKGIHWLLPIIDINNNKHEHRIHIVLSKSVFRLESHPLFNPNTCWKVYSCRQ